jgi:far upstream element-binding protein
VERAKAMIMEKIGMPVTASTYGNYGGSSGGGSSWGGDGGPYGQPGGAGVPGGMPGPGGVNPSTGQPDYSAQWADYYRSVGMLREAEAIEQQMRVIYFFTPLLNLHTDSA